MASTSGGAHGGSRRNSSRKKRYASQKDYRKVWEGEHKRVYFYQNILKSWKEAKVVAGYVKASDSDFAAHLRQSFVEGKF